MRRRSTYVEPSETVAPRQFGLRRRSFRTVRGVPSAVTAAFALIGALTLAVLAVSASASASGSPEKMSAIACASFTQATDATTCTQQQVDEVTGTSPGVPGYFGFTATTPQVLSGTGGGSVSSTGSASTTGVPASVQAPDGGSASPTPTALSSTDPSALAASGFGTAFATSPSSGAVVCNGQSNVTISGHTFRGIGSPTPAITIRGCDHVVITQNDFVDDSEPIYVVDSHDVVIDHNRYRNITGPHQRDGSHRGNFTQWESSTGGAITDNVGVGGDTEDIVSIYKSGGDSAASPLVISGNWFQGTNWSSPSGSGMMLGDGGGSHVVVRGNTLVDPGQVGIGVSGGSDIHVTGNTVFGEARALSNVGIYVWGQGVTCSDIEVSGNSVDFAKASGAASGGWNGGTCGAVTGWSTNDFTASLSIAALQAEL